MTDKTHRMTATEVERRWAEFRAQRRQWDEHWEEIRKMTEPQLQRKSPGIARMGKALSRFLRQLQRIQPPWRWGQEPK